jgi:hypothetical protein
MLRLQLSYFWESNVIKFPGLFSYLHVSYIR